MVDLSAQFAFGQGGLLPQEEVLEVRKKSKQFVVGIPKETDKNEHRVPLTPQGVEILVRQGIVVLKEANAGIESKYCDEDYAEAGAVICSSTDDIENWLCFGTGTCSCKGKTGDFFYRSDNCNDQECVACVDEKTRHCGCV